MKPRVSGSLLLASVLAASVHAQGPVEDPPPLEWFFNLGSFDDAVAEEARVRIAARWLDSYASMIVDIARFTRAREPSRTVDVSGMAPRADTQTLTHAPQYAGAQFSTIDPTRDHPTTRIRARLTRLLQQQTGRRFADDFDQWRRWTWSLPYEPHPQYLAFKAELFDRLDPTMGGFFAPGTAAAVRLDELEWSGARANDVLPLFEPASIAPQTARDVRDDERVVGLTVNGEARAYPRRLLALHRIVHDSLGGRGVIVVHCPLAGVTAAFEATIDGRPAQFGASGLVYRSATLMFDEETRSLWTMLTGRAVLGDMAGRNLALEPLPMVVTTWGDWRGTRPATTLVPPETGRTLRASHRVVTREQLEGIGLGFPVPHTSRALPARSDVLGIRLEDDGRTQAVAIPMRELTRASLRAFDVDGRHVVVLTSRAGAARVYDGGGVRFIRPAADGTVEDQVGRRWSVGEDALTLAGTAEQAPRVPAVQASWFTWYAYWPDTVVAN